MNLQLIGIRILDFILKLKNEIVSKVCEKKYVLDTKYVYFNGNQQMSKRMNRSGPNFFRVAHDPREGL